MRGEVDQFDFVLAEKLGMSLAQVRALPSAECVEWRAYYEWQTVMAPVWEAQARRGR